MPTPWRLTCLILLLQKREKMYDDDDERPNVDYGPLNVRTGMSEENDQYEVRLRDVAAQESHLVARAPGSHHAPTPTRHRPQEKDSLALALELASQANDTKSVDIRVLNVQKLVFWTRYFVLATCFSKPQARADAYRRASAAAAAAAAAALAPRQSPPACAPERLRE